MDHNSPVSARLCRAILAVALAPWLVCASTMAQQHLREADAARVEEPSLAVVLQRAGAYVTEFQQRLSGIVAEERYVQDVTAFNKRPRIALHIRIQRACRAAASWTRRYGRR